MPDFGNAFSGLAADRKLTAEELIRAIRFMIAAEYEAVQLYTQLAESIDNELSKRVLLDIADEEIVHAGEFLALLKQLAPGEEAFYAAGAQEVQEQIDLLRAPTAVVAQEEPSKEGKILTVGSLIDQE